MYGYKPAVKNVIEPANIIKAVAKYYKVEVEELCRSIHRPMTAKKTAIYFLRKKTGLTNVQIGGMFNMRLAAVSKAAKNFERELAEDKRLLSVTEKINSTFEV